MPVKTTTQLYQSHGQFLDAADANDEGKFRDALNEVMPRIYKMGYWRDLLFEHSQDASDEYISLPPDTDSIVSAILDSLRSFLTSKNPDTVNFRLLFLVNSVQNYFIPV